MVQPDLKVKMLSQCTVMTPKYHSIMKSTNIKCHNYQVPAANSHFHKLKRPRFIFKNVPNFVHAEETNRR